MSAQTFENSLLEIARKSIESYFSSKELDYGSYVERFKQLKESQATFVTLSLNGELRGCIGSLLARRSLLEDIVSNARSAAFGDPRFTPLSLEEFDEVQIEVSILSEPVRLVYDDTEDLKRKIKTGVDGVILKYNQHQATFLPQVWEQLNSFELFFEHLCLKAGLQESCLVFKPEIYTYSVQKIKENAYD